jgi:hypothetical protein
VRRADIGESKKHTPDKQDVLRGILTPLCRSIWPALIKKGRANPPVVMFDLTAGDGRCEVTKEGKGSPLIMCDQLTAANLDYRAWFIERDPISYQQLALTCRGNPWASVINADSDWSPAWSPGYEYLCSRTDAVGLIYADPTGATVPLVGINSILQAPAARMIDVLINISATSTKRVDAPRIEDIVDAIPRKRYWLIREPQGQFQWTFLIGSNWGDFPEWRKRRFARLSSTEGREWLRRATLTAKEEASIHQATLPFDLTATIASISAIHGFLK